MQHYAKIILWVYIVLLVLGGLMGFLKAGSKISLIMSASFAAGLILAVTGIVSPQIHLDTILLATLLIFFAMRLSKGKKFMPAGLMLVLTIVTLALLNIRF